MTVLDAAAEDVLGDTASIRAELARIEANLLRDPGAAIGKAKNLVEATAKAVLIELGKPYNDKDDVNDHVRDAMVALGIDRKSVAAHDVDMANVMGRLNSLTITLSDLHNHAGDGHGLSSPAAGLDLRHGRLAVRGDCVVGVHARHPARPVELTKIPTSNRQQARSPEQRWRHRARRVDDDGRHRAGQRAAHGRAPARRSGAPTPGS
ncbi:abortive infection family protein [Kutzneria buriramensis]|uniref:Abortive infection Abi-like protein n=1 Tax=Kutzneria buriramensis TaxID=1045776 RepID=A0A3E0HM49_9PSEU|nr:abortive infection family protein [Kutzneria buriramensis]REH47296.1 abortive infection Abi-like protein [Kutzneria buriramensis]